jgi:molybdate transport system ATP-binding protein
MLPEAARRMEIVLDHLNLSRGGRRILHEVSWHIRPGERWLVVGGSGAGKTQLLKVVAGDVWPEEGGGRAPRRYFLDGEWHTQPVEVREELAWLGPERQDRYERYGWNHAAVEVVGTGLNRTDIPLQKLDAAGKATALRLLRRAGIGALARRRFLTLSYGERRLVLLARVLSWRARFLVLDEVATGLDERNRGRLYRLLGGDLGGAGWICSAHRAEDAPPGATHLLWLRAGRVVYAGPLTAARLRRAFADAAGADAEARARRRADARRARAAAKAGHARRTRSAAADAPLRAARPVIVLRRANVWIDGKRILRDIDLTVRRGECWVVHGANGSGKSTLLRTLYGDHAVAAGGSIERAGIVPGVPLDEFRARTGLVAPHLQTEYPRHTTVLDTVVSGLHSSYGLNFQATPAEKRRARAALAALGLEEFAPRPLAELSYGQVRRVLFARAQVLSPRLLLLDEAFTGLNAPLRAGLIAWVEERIDSGVTVVMATHYRREWPRNATHELMLSRGRVAYAGKVRR